MYWICIFVNILQKARNKLKMLNFKLFGRIVKCYIVAWLLRITVQWMERVSMHCLPIGKQLLWCTFVHSNGIWAHTKFFGPKSYITTSVCIFNWCNSVFIIFIMTFVVTLLRGRLICRKLESVMCSLPKWSVKWLALWQFKKLWKGYWKIISLPCPYWQGW